MGKIRTALVGAVMVALLAGCAAGTPGSSPSSGINTLAAARAQALQAKAIALTQDMERGDYASTLAVAGDSLKKAGVDEARLKAGWEQVGALAGAYESITGAFSASLAGGDVVYVVAKHATKSLRVLFSFVPGGEQLNGLNLNVATDAEIAQASGSTAAPSASGSATASATGTGEHSVDAAVTVGQYSLPGTLATPAGAQKRPIVAVLLWGSGPQDRDETIGAAGNKMFRDLADALAARGISSLRFDKRTRAVPTAWTATSTLDDEYFADAKAAIALLQARSDLAGYKIFVIGHSQGAMVLPNVLRDNPSVAGGVSLAGSPRSLFDIMYDQNVDAIGALAGKTDAEKQPLLAQSKQIMDAAKALTDPAGTVPEALASTMTAAYIVSLNRLKQAEVAWQLDAPLLFAQGEADRQVYLKADFEGWKTALAGRPNVTFAAYPGLNHLFMKTQGLAAPADYDAPATLDPTLASDIAAWLLAHAG